MLQQAQHLLDELGMLLRDGRQFQPFVGNREVPDHEVRRHFRGGRAEDGDAGKFVLGRGQRGGECQAREHGSHEVS